VSDEQTVLVIGEVPQQQLLHRVLGRQKVRLCRDPYEALMEMSRRHWPVILADASPNDAPALCRAARRLQPDSHLFGACPPAEEPRIRQLTPDVLDGYFITPLRLKDARKIQHACVTPPRGAGPGLSARQMAQLVRSARSMEELEKHLRDWTSQLLGLAVRWTDATQIPPGHTPLLLTAGDAPRALVAPRGDRSIDPQARAALDEVQQLLPVLVDAARRTEALHTLAITDHLTGAYNRRYFYHATDRILAESDRRGLYATLLLYDIDNFKRYNDTYGHAAGDEILRETAALMKQITRAHDVIARIGGDEFAVLFWEPQQPRTPDSQPPQTAFALADRFRKAVAEHAFPSLGPEARGVLTISGGLATFPRDGRTCRELLRAADKALREAKARGKDAIHLIGQQ